MLPGDVNNRKMQNFWTFPLASGVIFASIYVKYSMEIDGGFPRPYLFKFSQCKLLKTIKSRWNAQRQQSSLIMPYANHGHAKKRNSEG